MGLAGTAWVFNGVISIPGSYYVSSNVIDPPEIIKVVWFESGGTGHKYLVLDTLNLTMSYADTSPTQEDDIVYNGLTQEWKDDKCRIISFTEEPNSFTNTNYDTFVAWLNSNAVRYVPKTGEKFIVYENQLNAIGDAIRSRTNKSNRITFPSGYVSEIEQMKFPPVVREDVLYRFVFSSQTTVRIDTKASGTTPRYVSATPPQGKRYIFKKAKSLSIFNVSQNLADYCFELDDNYHVLLYSATGSEITVTKPQTGSNKYIDLYADVFEVDS